MIVTAVPLGSMTCPFTGIFYASESFFLGLARKLVALSSLEEMMVSASPFSIQFLLLMDLSVRFTFDLLYLFLFFCS
jgi:hypothetical protein